MYLFKYGLCLLIKILEELKNSNAFELLSFSDATMPEKYFAKFSDLIFSKLLLLEVNGIW